MKKITHLKSIFKLAIFFYFSSISVYTAFSEVNFNETMSEIESIIKTKYVNQADQKTIQDGAFHGMMRSLDPYSAFFNADEYSEFKNNTSGEFSGIGIEISRTVKNDKPIVTNVMKDSPASNAGIVIGDIIVAVNGEKTEKMNVGQMAKKIRGEKNTDVLLSIFRSSINQFLDINVTRGEIKIESITSKILQGNIGYIEIKIFNQKSYKDFVVHLQRILQKQDLTALIIDVRSNPGGLLDPAVNIANIFLKPGKMITSVKGKDEVKIHDYISNNKIPLVNKDITIFVLTNKGSASASEILAAALKENKVALVCGEKTFGKASVQEIMDLKTYPGAAIKLTIAKYYTPMGNMIHEVGIIPDIAIEDHRTKDGNDNILSSVINIIKNGKI